MSYSALAQFVGRLALIGLLAFVVLRVVFLSHSGRGDPPKAVNHAPQSTVILPEQRKTPPAVPSLEKLSKALNKSMQGRPSRKMPKPAPVHEWDNRLILNPMRWGDFVKLPHEVMRNPGVIPPAVLASLRVCPPNPVDNATRKVCTNVRFLSLSPPPPSGLVCLSVHLTAFFFSLCLSLSRCGTTAT